MKRYKHLFEQIISFENLIAAFRKAVQGKRSKAAVATFEVNLEKELLQLEKELWHKTYHPGSYRSFFIHDPKKRLISAAPFRDRVVHHAICNVIEPIFERTFIHDSYANRKGKGTHKAIVRYQQYARQYKYVLKCDIRKFFPSIDHEILKQELRWKIACPDTLWLLDLIIDASNLQEPHAPFFPGDDLFTPQQRRRGLPIGNLTSQFWANVYMNRFDHFVKEELRVPGYIRYVDDFVLFHNSTSALAEYRQAVHHYLESLRLLAHPNKTHIHATQRGVPFLGFRVYPYYRVLQKVKTHRFRRYLHRQVGAYRNGTVPALSMEQSLNSWLGHIRFGQSHRLERYMMDKLIRHGVPLALRPHGSFQVF